MDNKDLLLLDFLSKHDKEKPNQFFTFSEYSIPPELTGEFVFDLKSEDSIYERLRVLASYGLVKTENSNKARILPAGNTKLGVTKQAIAEKEKEKNLQMQKLIAEVEDITQRVADYDTVKKNANRANILALLALLGTAIMIVIELIKLKSD